VDLILYRSKAELISEASRSYLGVIWWVLEPALYVGVFYLVFGLGLRRGGEGFVEFLLVGLVVWKLLDSTIRTSAGIISTSVGLINQVYLPKIILPLIIIATNTIKFFIILSLLLILLIVIGVQPTLHWFWIPVLVLVQLLWVYSLSGLAAAVVPFIPDVRYLVNYGMTLLFFMSGIFFDIRDMEPEIQKILYFNPVAAIIDQYRLVILHGESPAATTLLTLTVVALLLAVLVQLMYKKFDKQFPRVVG
jgi:lipopolysaccharide transport system permease protein